MGLTRKQKIMVCVLVFGAFVTMLNQTVVAPAQPSIMREMGIGTTLVQWLTTGFTLVNAIVIPIAAFISDRFRTRVIYLACMAVFLAGTIVCALAPNFPLLLVGRLVQASSVGVLMPVTMTVMMLMFPVSQRGTAMGLFGVVLAFAPAIGPSLSGVVIDHASWRVMFWIVVALAVVSIVAGVFFMGNVGERRDTTRLDPLSVLLSTVGFGGLLYGCSSIGGSSFAWWDIVIALVGVAAIVAFYFRQLKSAKPMLEVRVLANRRFLISTIIGMVVQAALLAGGVLMPIYLQSMRGFSATTSGLVLLPGALLLGALGPITGRLFDKHGPRALSLTGIGTLTVASLCFAFLTDATPLAIIIVLYTVRMASIGLINMPIMTWGMNALDNSLMNHGTSVNNTLRQVAGSMGTAVLVSASAIATNLAMNAGADDTHANIIGIDWAFGISAVLAAIALTLTIAFVRQRKAGAETTDLDKERRSVLEAVMRRDVYTLPVEATMVDAMRLMVDKGISAAPIIDAEGRPVGFISDGDIMRYLAKRGDSMIDPAALTMIPTSDDADFSQRLAKLSRLKVSDVATRGIIGVDIHDDLTEVCRVLGENHLKKVPVLEDGRVVGVINRSNITQYSMKEYLDRSN